MITRLLELQKKMMFVLGVETGDPSTFTSNPVFTAALVGVAKEAMEAHDAHVFVGKPWKHVDQAEAIRHTKEEMIDILFMLLEAFIVAGMDESAIVAEYERKFRVNLTRAVSSRDQEASNRALATLYSMVTVPAETAQDKSLKEYLTTL